MTPSVRYRFYRRGSVGRTGGLARQLEDEDSARSQDSKVVLGILLTQKDGPITGVAHQELLGPLFSKCGRSLHSWLLRRPA